MTAITSTRATLDRHPTLASPTITRITLTDTLPRPECPFTGIIHELAADSTPARTEIEHAPAGAPSVIVIMLDDVGFGAASTFGGPVPTPALDRVANAGLRYNQFHTTALCSPTRAALLTGRNHHSARMGGISEIAYGFPGYDGIVPRSTPTIGEILRLNGYSTAWFGKGHVTPMWETSPAGPFDRWPTGMGFERFYGFLGGEASQWEPALPTTSGSPGASTASTSICCLAWMRRRVSNSRTANCGGHWQASSQG